MCNSQGPITRNKVNTDQHKNTYFHIMEYFAAVKKNELVLYQIIQKDVYERYKQEAKIYIMQLHFHKVMTALFQYTSLCGI